MRMINVYKVIVVFCRVLAMRDHAMAVMVMMTMASDFRRQEVQTFAKDRYADEYSQQHGAQKSSIL